MYAHLTSATRRVDSVSLFVVPRTELMSGHAHSCVFNWIVIGKRDPLITDEVAVEVDSD